MFNPNPKPGLRPVFFILILLASGAARGQNQNRSDQSYLSSTAELALDFYQHVLSPIRQPTSKCQFEPSCSQFAREAVAQYGPFVGTMLAADRLMRCGTHASRSDYPYDGQLFYDPPEKNYVFGQGGMWKLGLNAHNRSIPRLTDTAVLIPLRFAYSLYFEQEFDFSIIELKRLQSNSENSTLSNYANALVAIDYLRQQSLKKARAAIDQVIPNTLDSVRQRNAFLVDYLIADAEDLDAWNAGRCRDASHKSQMYSNLAAYALTKEEQYDSAAAAVPSSTDYVMSVRNSGHKSPTLAGIMGAVLPGSGYVYAGRFGEGISALTFNGLLGWGIYSLFKNHNTGSGILVSSIALPFYLGNIVGSYNAAAAENARSQAIALGSLRHALQLDFYFSTDFLDRCWK
ncbi:MAG: membrane protein insertion efficiency factor YidD [Bacteroidota bacterium]|nr:membrane protein insertion efficiency factor YidD [Bacteroidota bacterium]